MAAGLITLRIHRLDLVIETLSGMRKNVDSYVNKGIATALRKSGTATRLYFKAQTGLETARTKRRFYLRTKGDNKKLWVGVEKVAAGYIRPLIPAEMNPRQQRMLPGARAGKWNFPGAFVARMDSGHIGIYKRRGPGRDAKLDEQYVPISALAGVPIYMEQQVSANMAAEVEKQVERVIRDSA